MLLRSVLLLILTVSGVLNAQVLLRDDFNSGSLAGWQRFDGQFRLVNGEVEIRSSAPCQDARMVIGSTAWSDYVVDVDFNMNNQFANRHIAVLFRVESIFSGCDAGRYYQFYAFSGVAGICLIDFSNGFCTSLVQVPFNTPQAQWKHLRLKVEGPTVDAWIGGQQVLSYSGLTQISAGRVGLKAINAGNVNLYDNFTVSAIGTPAGSFLTDSPVLAGSFGSLSVSGPPNAPIFVFLDTVPGAIPTASGLTTQLGFSSNLFVVADPTGFFGVSIAPTAIDSSGFWGTRIQIPLSPSFSGLTLYSEACILHQPAPNGVIQSNLAVINFR